jgi:CHASE3 domain sensor protein
VVFLIFGAPFVFLGLLIGLVYWIVKRMRRPTIPTQGTIVGRG